MRDYQCKKNNPYRLRRKLYKRIVDIIADYEQTKQEYDNILYGSSCPDGQPRGNSVGDPTGRKVEARERRFAEIKAIEQALLEIPPEYRQGILDNICYGAWYPNDAATRTYKTHKQRFIYHTGVNLGLVDEYTIND
jgi:hypothetical protein